MRKAVTYSIVDYPDGQFTVVVISASGSVHLRGPLLTLAEAELCVQELRELLALCGGVLVRRCLEVRGRNL